MRLLRLAALAIGSFLGAGGASSGTASTVPVQRFGKVFAVSACGPVAGFRQARCFAKVVTDARGNILDGKASATANIAPSGYGPADLRSAYNVTPAGAPGSGPTIAIVDAYGYTNAEVDLATYRQQFGIGACTTNNGCFRKVNQNGVQGSYPRVDTGWAQEQALDLDMAAAMCPNCKILLVQATTSSGQDLAVAVNTAVRLGATVVSNSYGGSESGTESIESSYNHPGVAITVSSGDNGYGVQFPASSPHVIAVGGTALTHSGSGWSETAWAGAGSGCSTVYGILAGTQSSATTSCANRAVADVSAVADPSTGVAVYGPVSRTRSGWMVFGGTSVAAPVIGGIYGAANNAPSIGSPGALIYSSSSSAFRDVVSGSNGNCGTKLCNGAVGWDGPTGRGTPHGTTAF